MRAGDVAWLVLGIGIVAYEASSPKGELLSEAYDRYVDRFPITARLFSLIVCMHVVNLLPRWADPVHGLFCLLRR